MKDIKILISSLLIILSFFIGYFYKGQSDKIGSFDDESEKKYVNLNINKSKVSIDNQNEDIIILINGEEIIENTEINF